MKIQLPKIDLNELRNLTETQEIWKVLEEHGIYPNTNRNFTYAPIRWAKVEVTAESIHKTGFWDNIMFRPLDNSVENIEIVGLVNYLASKDEADFPVELCYGHHRIIAALAAGIEEIDVPVKFVDDDTHLQIMVQENRQEFSSDMFVQIEAIRQVKNFLKEIHLEPFESFDDYEEAELMFFENSKAWANAKSQGIGIKTLKKYLGDTWPENDIRAVAAAIDAIDEGLFEQDFIMGFPSIGILNRYVTLVRNVTDLPGVPQYLKDNMIRECANEITSENTRSTVKVVDLAAKAVKKGHDPLVYLQKQKKQEWKAAKECAILIESKTFKSVEEMMESDGFAGMTEEFWTEVQKAVDAAQKKALAAAADPEQEGDGTSLPEGIDPNSEVERALAEAEEAAGSGAHEPPDFMEFVEPETDADGVYTVQSVSHNFVVAATTMAEKAALLNGRVNELDESDPYFSALDTSLRALLLLALDAYGVQDVKQIVDEVEKASLS